MSESQVQAAPPSFTPSERVLLFGDRFSEPAGMLSVKEEILTSGAKVKAEPLVVNAISAALFANEQAGSAKLEMQQGKALFGLLKTEHLHVAPGSRPASWPAGSLEHSVAQAAAKNLKVYDYVTWLISQRTNAPHQRITNAIKIGLAQRGLLDAQDKTTLRIFHTVNFSLPDATRALAAQTGTDDVQALLGKYEAEQPKLFAAVQRQIKSAISAMTETND